MSDGRGGDGDAAAWAEILRPGETCGACEPIGRAAPLVDGAAHFPALADAMERARHGICILGWDIRSDLVLDPDRPEPLRRRLDRLVRANPGLEVRILVWDWIFVYGLDREPLPWLWLGLLTHERVHFELDDRHPPGGAHHEKLVVIDDRLAFVGGIDLTAGRFDTPRHDPRDRWRGRGKPPFHDVMLMLEGPLAARLGAFFRERWRLATGEELRAPPAHGGSSPWSDRIEPWWRDVRGALARTDPGPGDADPVREIEALYCAAIGAARRTICIENQYLTAVAVREALAKRLGRGDGVEVVVVTTTAYEGVLEKTVMDSGRERFVARLQEAGRGDRVRVLAPMIDGPGGPMGIVVHSKLMIVDDDFVTVGSANLANRSMGLDTECNVALVADPGRAETREAVRRLRETLLAEHLGCSREEFAQAVERSGSLVAAVDALNGGPRHLVPVRPSPPPAPAELVEAAGIADSDRPVDAEMLLERLAPPRRLTKLVGGAAGVLLFPFAATVLWQAGLAGENLPLRRFLGVAAEWRLTGLDLFAVLAVYTAASLVLVPVTLLVGTKAVLFGPWLGFVYALLGAEAAALAGFAIGRRLGAGRIRRLAGSRARALARRIERSGLLGTVIARMVPAAPFGLVNLAAGAAGIRFVDFALGNLLGLLPGTFLLAVYGDRLGAFLRRADPLDLALLVGATALVVAAGWLLQRWTRSRLQQSG